MSDLWLMLWVLPACAWFMGGSSVSGMESAWDVVDGSIWVGGEIGVDAYCVCPGIDSDDDETVMWPGADADRLIWADCIGI